MGKRKGERTVLKLVRKSNDLVEARYKFDIWETRVFTKMLTMVRSDDEDFRTYRIYLKDVVQDFGLENNNDAYERLRAGGMKLMNKVVKVVRNTDEGLMELNTPIVVGVEKLISPNSDVEDAKFIDISFHPKMKPFLLSLKSHYTTYDARNILGLPSSYSIRIYELLKQYQKIGRRKFFVQELKEIIGVIEEIDVNGKKKYKDNYPLYGNFKQRVLLKAQKDLKKYTDIAFTFDQIKKGRAVKEILFHIFPNSPKRKNASESKLNELTEINEVSVAEVHEMVKEWVSMSTVRSWFAKYPEPQIKKGVSYTLRQLREGKKINEVGGYLQTMVAKSDLIDPDEGKRKDAEKKRQKKEEQAAKKIRLEQSLKMLQIEQLKAEDEIIEKLLDENPGTKTAILEAIKGSLFSGYKKELTEEENMQSPIYRASYRNEVKKQFAGFFEEMKITYERRIKELKIELSKM